MENYNHNASVVKLSIVKSLLIRKYGEDTGFHMRHQKKLSDAVYDKQNCSSYIEVASYFLHGNF